MTRQYWTAHARHDLLNTNDRYVALLIIRSFMEPEIPAEQHEPYERWKQWLSDNPVRKQRDK